MAAWPSHFPTYDKFDPLGERIGMIGTSPTIHPYWWIRLGQLASRFSCAQLRLILYRASGAGQGTGLQWGSDGPHSKERSMDHIAQHKKDRAVIADNAPMTQRIQHNMFQNNLGCALLIVQDSCSGSRFDVLSLCFHKHRGCCGQWRSMGCWYWQQHERSVSRRYIDLLCSHHETRGGNWLRARNK